MQIVTTPLGTIQDRMASQGKQLTWQCGALKQVDRSQQR